jgi:hypothetical protein
MTNGTNSVTLTPANTIQMNNSFDATPTAITVATQNDLIWLTTASESTYYFWESASPSPGVGYGGRINNTMLWAVGISSVDTPVATSTVPVPEPSSAVLAVLGAGILITSGLARQRWAKRPQAAAWHTQPTASEWL